MGVPQDLVEAARRAGICDPRVLEAIARVPRAGFVPPELRSRAYVDAPIPIPRGQVTTQPSLVARMVEGLELNGGERVLEIGTGYGWQTALLATLAGEVVSVERWSELAAAAVSNLREASVERCEIVVGDGSRGLPQRSPYQSVLVSAAYPRVPMPLVEQLEDGGRLVQPIGSGGNERVTVFLKVRGRLVERGALTGAHFVRLWGRHGFPVPEGEPA